MRKKRKPVSITGQGPLRTVINNALHRKLATKKISFAKIRKIHKNIFNKAEGSEIPSQRRKLFYKSLRSKENPIRLEEKIIKNKIL